MWKSQKLFYNSSQSCFCNTQNNWSLCSVLNLILIFVYKTYSQNLKTLLSSLMFVRVNSLEGELRRDNFVSKHSQTLIWNTEISLTLPAFFFSPLNLIYRHHSVTGCQGTAETTLLFPWQQQVSNRKGICRVCSSPLQSLWQRLMNKT